MVPHVGVLRCRAHDLRWAVASTLLMRGAGSTEGLLWLLLRHGSNGVQWIMHTMPRLGWLLAAAEACYCSGGPMGGGTAAQRHRSALAAVLSVCSPLPFCVQYVPRMPWRHGMHVDAALPVAANQQAVPMQKRIAWMRRQFDDLSETLFSLHCQDVSHFGACQTLPADVLAAATAAMRPMPRPGTNAPLPPVPHQAQPVQPRPPVVPACQWPQRPASPPAAASVACSRVGGPPPAASAAAPRPVLMPANYAHVRRLAAAARVEASSGAPVARVGLNAAAAVKSEVKSAVPAAIAAPSRQPPAMQAPAARQQPASLDEQRTRPLAAIDRNAQAGAAALLGRGVPEGTKQASVAHLQGLRAAKARGPLGGGAGSDEDEAESTLRAPTGASGKRQRLSST